MNPKKQSSYYKPVLDWLLFKQATVREAAEALDIAEKTVLKMMYAYKSGSSVKINKQVQDKLYAYAAKNGLEL